MIVLSLSLQGKTMIVSIKGSQCQCIWKKLFSFVLVLLHISVCIAKTSELDEALFDAVQVGDKIGIERLRQSPYNGVN